MNFTREPLIETVITPREGCKLVIRSSKGNGQEDYFVDAVEVVSFGHSFFFRSQERPRAFLVPVSDYEVLELKETRMVLKNVSTDRSIKIGGGRETTRPREEQVADTTLTESRPAPISEQHPMGKRDKRRRGRRGRDRHEHPQDKRSDLPSAEESRGDMHQLRDESDASVGQASPLESPSPEGEVPEKAPSFISKLFPPPPILIKESLSRYKPAETDEDISIEEKPSFEETLFKPPAPTDPDDENEE